MHGARVALITGANKGLGKETARQLGIAGISVVLGCRDTGRGGVTARELADLGLDAAAIQLDVTDSVSIEAAATRIADERGRLDILVNNAGTLAGASALEIAPEHMRRTFEVNVFGVVATIRAFLPLLRQSASPRIVNVSSTTASMELTAASAELPGDATRRLDYTSAKAALNMLTLQYAQAFARQPELHHIKINSVSPGYTATDMNQHCGHRHVSEGARAIASVALAPCDGPTGGFFDESGTVPW